MAHMPSVSPKTNASERDTRPLGNWTHGGTRHHRIDVGVVPHIERTCGASSGSYAKKSNDTGEGIDAAWCDHETD